MIAYTLKYVVEYMVKTARQETKILFLFLTNGYLRL